MADINYFLLKSLNKWVEEGKEMVIIDTMPAR